MRNIRTIASSLQISYWRLKRIIKRDSKFGLNGLERKSIKEYIDTEAEKCKQEIDEL